MPDADDVPVRRRTTPALGELLAGRVSRRGFLVCGSLASCSALLPVAALSAADKQTAALWQVGIPVSGAINNKDGVAKGFARQVLIRWGDGVLPGAPAFDWHGQTPETQAQQFGYNNDYITVSRAADGTRMLCVNHETPSRLMFPPGGGGTPGAVFAKIEMQAVGHTLVALDTKSGKLTIDSRHPANRRITATTPCILSGAAAGHSRLKTSSDSSGRNVLGTFGNCAGGHTPWGTVLTCEENIDHFFHGQIHAGHSEARNHRRMGIGGGKYPAWAEADERFDAIKHPNEANRFGWVVEIDPRHPEAPPVKHTALGRFKHEGATVCRARDGRVVVYMGDDQVFEYLYKYVSDASFDKNAQNNWLTEGTLYVARLDEDGGVAWLPLRHGHGGLTSDNGFASQADVLIETRHAADVLGATPLDRPEGIAVHPASGAVAVALTKNPLRPNVMPGSPTIMNRHGHILMLAPENDDHGAARATWDVLLKGSDDPQGLACPDNLVYAPDGSSLWVATDGAEDAASIADGFYQLQLEGKRLKPKRLYRAPVGAEITGPCFDTQGQWLLLAVQHPGHGSDPHESFTTRWPDFDPALPPRPAVVVIRPEPA